MSKSMVCQSTTDGQEAKVTRHHQPIQLPQWLVSFWNIYMPVRPIRYPAICATWRLLPRAARNRCSEVRNVNGRALPLPVVILGVKRMSNARTAKDEQNEREARSDCRDFPLSTCRFAGPHQQCLLWQ
jgi:hypothetical protein